VLLVVLLVAGLVVGEVLTGGGDDSGGRAAPALPTTVLVPPKVTIGSLRGKPAVINFWASWCEPCRREADDLRRFAESLRGRATLVGVNFTDELTGARKFLREERWKFPNLRDPDGEVGGAYGIVGMPTTFVLDREGRIAATLRGPQTDAKLEQAVRDVEQG
jgi:thiol-disulfide isomerase/thioredoxin